MGLIYDPFLGRIRYTWSPGAGIDMSGGTISVITPPDGVPYVAGTGIGINGATITNTLAGSGRIGVAGGTASFNVTADIVTVTGTSVTLNPDTAYKVYATSQAVTINANAPASGKWGLEGHLEIFVAGTGYVQTGENVVLANALEPDAVNNCTVRFHDGLAIISVEDHIAGYVVVSATGTTAGTLPYALTSATQEYVAFDATLNGQTIDLAGATASGEKHIVGNGYNETVLSGGITCTSKTTFSNLSMDGVVASGGTITLGDVNIPNGATVAVISGGGLAVEKVTGNGGTIDLGGTNVNVSPGTTASANSVTFTSGSAGSDTSSRGGAFHTYGGTFALTNCTVSGNGANGVVGGGLAVFGGGSIHISNCTVSGNTGIGDIYVAGASSLLFINGGTYGKTVLNAGKMEIAGQNAIDTIVTSNNPGTVTISSGASINLTSSINPGGSITFEAGGATVLYSSGAVSGSYSMDNVTLPAGAKLTNTAAIDLGSAYIDIGTNPTAFARVTITGYTAITGRGAVSVSNNNSSVVQNVALEDCTITGCSAYGYSVGGALFISVANSNTTVTLSSCRIYGNTGVNAPIFGGGGQLVLKGSEIEDQTVLNSTNVSFVASNSLKSTILPLSGYSGTVTFTSGAVLDLTENPYDTPVAPGGRITIPASAVVTIIGSDGTTSAYLSELELTGSTITNQPAVLGATVTIPANGETYEVHFADGTSSTYTGGATERQEVLDGAVVYIGGQ